MKKMLVALPLVRSSRLAAATTQAGSRRAAQMVGYRQSIPSPPRWPRSFGANPGTSVISNRPHGRRHQAVLRRRRRAVARHGQASRRFKKSEYDSCAAAGVKNVSRFGRHRRATLTRPSSGPLNLTVEHIYKALAANPSARARIRPRLEGLDPSLRRPDRVLDRAATSGTRDRLASSSSTRGATPIGDEGVKESDEKKHRKLAPRSRGRLYVEPARTTISSAEGSADPGALGVLGYSFLERMRARVAVVDGGVAPTEATISDLSYPYRPCCYVRRALAPSRAQELSPLTPRREQGRTLEKRGLVPLATARRSRDDPSHTRSSARPESLK